MNRDVKWTFPVGLDSFRKVREGNKYYIDKSLFIADFCRLDETVTLITRPRRFGKTLNMSMLREFFGISKESSEIFKGLDIMDTVHAQQMNSRPTLYFTFKGVSGSSIEALKVSLAHVVKEAYYSYASVFEQRDNEFYAIWSAFKKMDQETEDDKRKVNSDVLKRSLLVLIRLLFDYYNQPVLLLIDEYDQPLIASHEFGFRELFSTEIYGSFLGDALKGNESLGQSMLTGIQRVAKESIFSNLNNLAVYTVADKRYAQYFGLTEEETKVALEVNGLVLNDEVKQFYDGYHIGGFDIYNPWSVIKYISLGELNPYWINTSTNLLIRELILKADEDFYMDFESLITDGRVHIPATLDASFFELESPETLWGLLINAGYLTISEKISMEEFIVRIPNFEVKREFRTIVGMYVKFKSNSLNLLFNALFDKDMDRFLMHYRKMMIQNVSFHDTVDENSFHMFFLGMCMMTQGLYEVTSNREMGHGRSDIGMKSLFLTDRPHIVIEFKTGEDVKKEADDALTQILDRAYYADFEGDVLCVGIGHFKKKCELVSKLVQA